MQYDIGTFFTTKCFKTEFLYFLSLKKIRTSYNHQYFLDATSIVTRQVSYCMSQCPIILSVLVFRSNYPVQSLDTLEYLWQLLYRNRAVTSAFNFFLVTSSWPKYRALNEGGVRVNYFHICLFNNRNTCKFHGHERGSFSTTCLSIPMTFYKFVSEVELLLGISREYRFLLDV